MTRAANLEHEVAAMVRDLGGCADHWRLQLGRGRVNAAKRLRAQGKLTRRGSMWWDTRVLRARERAARDVPGQQYLDDLLVTR